MPSLSRSGPKMLFDQAAVEAVVAGGHRRVRGEDGVLGDFAQRVVEVMPSSSIRSRITSSVANALWPSFR